MRVSCSICGEPAQNRLVTVRSGKDVALWHCIPCDFDFFAHDPTAGLVANKLDESRLKAAGLDIPTLERDFENGIAQSHAHVAEYLDSADQEANILEIGCSWGYFLKLARDAGSKVYGVELNTARARYVNDMLKIPCDTNLDVCEGRGVRFRKIFLFYVLEYVPQPVSFLQRLTDMLDTDGRLVLVTPNLNDALKDLWRNEGFRRFFYDEHAVNYMTPHTVERMLARVRVRTAEVSTRQGYSFVNHLSWFLTQAPRTTGVVGGDNFVSDITAQLRRDASLTELTAEQRTLAARLADLITGLDAEYRHLLEDYRYGNQIRVVAYK
jgi:2-polyprenyl-3-methyl-5-hydroxy-6-metoxy-1,4-benzoquinol methylase